MTKVKRILLVVLITITSLAILLQLYQIFKPHTQADRDIKYVELVKQYQLVKMERIVLEEQYALAKTKNKIVSLPAFTQKNSSAQSPTPSAVKNESLPLSAQEAASFEQIEAYVSNNKPNQPQPLTPDEKNLLTSSGDDFTLQLMGVRDLKELTRYCSEHQVADAQIFHTYYLNKDWYVLVSGRFKNHTEALKAIGTLPDDIKELKPWIRQLSTIQKALQLYR